MKMVKAMKKLKFWSRKKKKKKPFLIDHPPPSPPCHCQYHYYYPFEPSAPPLPASSSSSSSWLEYDHETQAQAQARARAQLPTFAPEDIINSVPERISPQDPTMQGASTTYQQYMVPNPSYGVPVVAQVRRERRGGAFGCMFALGAHLFRCFFPYFHIREVRK